MNARDWSIHLPNCAKHGHGAAECTCGKAEHDAKPERKRPSWGEPGSKVARKTTAHVYSRGSRAVIVTIYPDGVIGLRLAKERREEFIDAADAYRNAVLTRKGQERAAKRRKK